MKKEKEQQNMDEIDKSATKNSIKIKKITPPKLPSEDEIKKEIGKIKKVSYKLKWKLISQILMQQKELIEKKIRGKIKKLIRNIVKTTEGLTVNDQITLQDINLPEPNIALPLQLPPNVNVIVDEITNNVLTKISPKALPDLPEPETQVIDTDIDQGLDIETINYFEDNYISKILPEIPDEQQQIP